MNTWTVDQRWPSAGARYSTKIEVDGHSSGMPAVSQSRMLTVRSAVWRSNLPVRPCTVASAASPDTPLSHAATSGLSAQRRAERPAVSLATSAWYVSITAPGPRARRPDVNATSATWMPSMNCTTASRCRSCRSDAACRSRSSRSAWARRSRSSSARLSARRSVRTNSPYRISPLSSVPSTPGPHVLSQDWSSRTTTGQVQPLLTAPRRHHMLRTIPQPRPRCGRIDRRNP